MRLVDVGKMRKAKKGMFIYQDEFEDDVQHVAFEAYTHEDIENAPTVDAIPIDWLLDYFAYIEDEVFENNLKITKDNIERVFDELIATWERENG